MPKPEQSPQAGMLRLGELGRRERKTALHPIGAADSCGYDTPTMVWDPGSLRRSFRIPPRLV
jgi:hypothetical protein